MILVLIFDILLVPHSNDHQAVIQYASPSYGHVVVAPEDDRYEDENVLGHEAGPSRDIAASSSSAIFVLLESLERQMDAMSARMEMLAADIGGMRLYSIARSCVKDIFKYKNVNVPHSNNHQAVIQYTSPSYGHVVVAPEDDGNRDGYVSGHEAGPSKDKDAASSSSATLVLLESLARQMEAMSARMEILMADIVGKIESLGEVVGKLEQRGTD
ncbi:hypothetical protein L1049_002637 [Liquidambar formosana]|uniref:Uncharacterized protein n=1 Tax=Liquidambar formosana TaxID=63359 RepID=A0AAP0R9C8_LIQFO